MVVNLISSRCFPYSEVGLIIKDICLLCERTSVCRVEFTPRKANMAAHCLAKLSLSLDGNYFWMEECPPSVVPVVLGDSPNLV